MCQLLAPFAAEFSEYYKPSGARVCVVLPGPSQEIRGCQGEKKTVAAYATKVADAVESVYSREKVYIAVPSHDPHTQAKFSQYAAENGNKAAVSKLSKDLG